MGEVVCFRVSVFVQFVTGQHASFWYLSLIEQRTVAMQFFGADPQSGSEVFARHGHILTSPQVAGKGSCHRPSKNRPWDKKQVLPSEVDALGDWTCMDSIH